MMLKVGDMVVWRSSWGTGHPSLAKVKRIEVVEPGQKEGGVSVEEIQWANKSRIVVDLDNGHWAYGYQIGPTS